MLKEKIYADLITAMKAKETLKLETLRGVKAEIMKFEVSGADKVVDDAEVIKIIKKLIKQRQDSATQFEAAGRDDSAKKELAEKELLEVYLPEQMSAKEVEKIIDEIITETGLNSKGDFGKLMGSVMQKTGGNADGNIVKSLLQKKLS